LKSAPVAPVAPIAAFAPAPLSVQFAACFKDLENVAKSQKVAQSHTPKNEPNH